MKELFDSQKGHNPQVKNHCSREKVQECTVLLLGITVILF